MRPHPAVPSRESVNPLKILKEPRNPITTPRSPQRPRNPEAHQLVCTRLFDMVDKDSSGEIILEEMRELLPQVKHVTIELV